MQKFVLLLWLASTGTFITNAQDSFHEAYKIALEKENSAPITATLFINEHPSKKEQFTGNWEKGSVIFTNGTKAKNKMLRYNGWKDELIWMRKSDYKRGTVIKDQVKEFSLGEKRFIHYYDNTSLFKQDIYLEVLAEGKISLYCHRKVTYIKSSDAFSTNYQYYLKLDSSLMKIRLRKSTIINSFTEEEQKIFKNIVRKNHLKIKNEYQMAKALDLFNKQTLK